MAQGAQNQPINESIISVVIQQKGIQRQDISTSTSFTVLSTTILDVSQLRKILEPAIQDLVIEFSETGKFPELGIIDPDTSSQEKEIRT